MLIFWSYPVMKYIFYSIVQLLGLALVSYSAAFDHDHTRLHWREVSLSVYAFGIMCTESTPRMTIKRGRCLRETIKIQEETPHTSAVPHKIPIMRVF